MATEQIQEEQAAAHDPVCTALQAPRSLLRQATTTPDEGMGVALRPDLVRVLGQRRNVSAAANLGLVGGRS